MVKNLNILFGVVGFAVLLVLCGPGSANSVDYTILAVRSERAGDRAYPHFAEVMDPIHHPPSDLVMIHPDGRIECITPMSQGSALHPELLRDGRLL